MITQSEEYWATLWKIQDTNYKHLALLMPSNNNTYDVNLTTRVITPPDYIGVNNDHAAETVYFKVDRYHDSMDLADTVCVIQYKNAKGNYYLYPVPFIDCETYSTEEQLLIPWLIDKGVTEKDEKGNTTITFSIKFYKLDSDLNYSYSLNTLTATTKVLATMDDLLGSEYYADTSEAGTYCAQLLSRVNELEKESDLYWSEVT